MDSSDHQVKASDEATPLLAASGNGITTQPNEEPLLHSQHTNGDVNGEDEDKPLPRAQIFLLCYARMVEPIAFFSIFPFINKMINEQGNVPQTSVGFYSGLIESLFSLTQMIVMMFWAWAADRLGRKPVLIFSLFGVSVATALFGLSKTIWQMILFRCFAGVFAGTIVTIRAMISENSTKKTQARAFSFFSFAGNVGIFIGPLIGGALSNPAEQYPHVFGKVQFFKDYPYALPTFAVGVVGLSAAGISLLIKETLDKKVFQDPSANPPMSTWEILKSPGVAIVVYIYGHVMLLAFAFTAVLPVFWFTPPSLGGFGFDPLTQSFLFAGAGISQSIWTLLALPPLQHRFGTGGLLRGCAIAWPITFAFWPFGNMLMRHGWKVAFWIVASINLATGSGVSMAFTGVQLALNDIAPTHATLGPLNGFALALVSGIRAFAPALFSSIFAIGVEKQILGGYLVWVILVILGLLLTLALRWLPEKAEGRLRPATDNQ